MSTEPGQDVVMKVPSAGARASADGPTLSVGSNLWVTWVEVAADHTREAREARQRARDVGAVGSEFGRAVNEEWRASLVGVVSSALALDAWYIAVKPMIDLPEHQRRVWSEPGSRTARATWINGTLQAGFTVGARFSADVRRLFQLRDQVVHHRTVMNPTEPHPTGRSNVSAEVAAYTCEVSAWSLGLAIDVIAGGLAAPRPALADLVKWSAARADVVAQLEAHRPPL